VPVGQPALFTVAAAGSAPLRFQWFRDGVAISGATTASYVTPATSASDSGSTFTVTITNQFGTVTSSSTSLTVVPAAAANTRFVAPNGNDSDPGTVDHPFRTIQHCATSVAAGWTCAVRAGTYRETVTPNSGVTITAFNYEPVTVDGSDPVTGWTLYQGNIYKASVTLGSGDTNQIFVGNEMMTEARWPNGDDLFHVNWATMQSGSGPGVVVDQNLPSANWAGAKIHLWSGTDAYSHETGIVNSSMAGRMSIEVDYESRCPYICPVAGGYYYLFGSLAALDTEREWFYDSNSATLYFMAPGKVNPSTLDVRSKNRQYAFDLRGKAGVTIRNLSIFASTIITDKGSSNNTLDRINAQYVSQFSTLQPSPGGPTGRNFDYLNVHILDSGFIIDGTGNTMENSTITYSAGTGVALVGSHNTIRNNLIQMVDYIGDYGSGIVLDGDNNTILNNTICCVGRMGILFLTALGQNIGYNNLFGAMMLTRDGAEIYGCCRLQAVGSRIHHNWIHDTTKVQRGLDDSFAMAGVYLDQNSSGFTVDQNVLWQNELFNIFILGAGARSGDNNDVRNNTIPDRSDGGFIAISFIPDCAATQVVDNRVVLGVQSSADESNCAISNNNAYAPGATEMSPNSEVGCNFDGCSSSPPPAILSAGALTPCPYTGDTSAAATNSQ
jgi:parallel beta-helix repeat protein